LDILSQVADGRIPRYVDAAGVGTDIAGDNFEQSGFPRTVLADDGNTVSHTDIQVDAAEERPSIIGLGYVRNSNHSGFTNGYYTGIGAFLPSPGTIPDAVLREYKSRREIWRSTERVMACLQLLPAANTGHYLCCSLNLPILRACLPKAPSFSSVVLPIRWRVTRLVIISLPIW